MLFDNKNVSRETLLKLEQYYDLLIHWNKTINLVSRTQTNEVWDRHIIDCLQLSNYIPPEAKVLTDFGSGGGLPGIILGIALPLEKVHLIEKDSRKCAFLHEASKLTQSEIIIHNQNIKTLRPWKSDVVTARALAPMDKLVTLLESFITQSKISLFLKGKNVVEEIEQASLYWEMSYTLHTSFTSNNSRLVELQRIRRRKKNEKSK